MSQTSPNSPVADRVTSPVEEVDPLAHLFKMSRTAGLGSGDYVAINPVAVTALVFGIASALVVVDSLFVLLPVVGLILGIIGWKQVRQSNGTQTGGLMAGLAILLSIGFLGGKVGKEGIDSFRRRADTQEIVRLIDGLSQELSAIDPAKGADSSARLANAYDVFDEAFKTRVPRQRFDTVWLATWSSPYYGPMVSMHSNGLLKFDTDARSGDLICTSIAVAQFQRGEAPRWAMVFRKLGGKWFIDDLPDAFPQEKAQQAGQAPGSGR